MRRLKLLASTAATLTASIALTSAANAFTADELKSELEASLGQILPITVIGPLAVETVTTSEDAGVLTATLSGVSYPDSDATFSDISMTLTPAGEGLFETAIELPTTLTLNSATYSFEGHKATGLWDRAADSYSSVEYGFGSLNVISGEDDKYGKMDAFAFSISPFADGSQSISVSMGMLEAGQPSDEQLFTMAPTVLSGTMSSSADLGLFALYREGFRALAEFDFDDMESDPSSFMQIMGSMITEYSGYSQTGKLGAMSYENGLEDLKFSLSGGTLTGDATDMDSPNREGTSEILGTLNDVTVTSPDVNLTIDTLGLKVAADGADGPFVFDFSRELYSKLSDPDAKVNLGDLFDLYFNFDNANMLYSLSGFDLDLPGEGQFLLSSASGGLAVKDARTDQAAIELTLDESEFSASRFSDPLTSAIMPQLIDLNVAIRGLPFGSLREALREESINAQMAAGNEDEIASMFQEIGFKLLGIMMLNAPEIVIEGSSIDSNTITFDIDGKFDVDPTSPRFVAGGVEVVANNVAELETAVQGAMTSDDPQAKQFAIPALTGIGVAKGFGQQQPDGGLLFDIELTSNGDLTVNGAPLPLP